MCIVSWSEDRDVRSLSEERRVLIYDQYLHLKGPSSALHAVRSRVRFPMVPLEFKLTYSFRPHYGPGVDSTCNHNKYQQYFLGVKTTATYCCEPYQLHMLIFLESGILNILEPSGPVQACTGIANS